MSGLGLRVRPCPAVRCDITGGDESQDGGLILTGCRDDASWHRPPAVISLRGCSVINGPLTYFERLQDREG